MSIILMEENNCLRNKCFVGENSAFVFKNH
jgi:hypothetical protein